MGYHDRSREAGKFLHVYLCSSRMLTDRQGWNQAYQYNLRLYNARVHSYKAGNASAKDMSDTDAMKYADDFQIPMPAVSGLEDPAGNDSAAIAEQLQASAPEPEDTAAKTPKAKASRKRKTATPGGEAEVAKSTPAAASPDKKRKRTSTKPVEPEKEEPKKSGRKKAKSG